MSEMSQVPLNHPVMLAWTHYMNTDAFKNSLMWATITKYSQAGRDVPNDDISSVQREEHAKGSLWAAFAQGFKAANTNTGVLQNDLREMLQALGLFDGARAQSPHQVFQECIAEVRRLKTAAGA